MEWGGVLSLGAVTLAVIGLVIYFGRILSNYVQKHVPESGYAQRLTWSGTVLFACLTAFLLVCAVAREFRPESSFGAFVGTTEGLIISIVTALFVVAIAGEVLHRNGYPIAKR